MRKCVERNGRNGPCSHDNDKVKAEILMSQKQTAETK